MIPILVPKSRGVVKEIPAEAVVGVSVPTKYAGFLPEATSLRGRMVHLLGGSPPQQREIYWYLTEMGADVVSLDINSHGMASDFGSYWNGFRWYDKDRPWIGKYEAFRRSCKGIREMWTHLGSRTN